MDLSGLNRTKFVLSIIVLTFLSSCTTQKKCAKRYPPTIDSVYIEKLRDVPVIIKGDSIRVEVPVIDCPDQDLYLYENEKLKQELQIKDGKLVSKTLIPADTVFVTVKDTEIREVIKPRDVPFTPLWRKITSNIGIILTLVIIGLFWLKK